MAELYFRMSNSILSCPAMQEIQMRRVGDSNSHARQYLFIKILTMCVDKNITILNARSLSMISGIAQKQTDLVWSACIKHGILREYNGGFSAFPWMHENGYIGKLKETTGKQAFYEAKK